MQILEAGLFYFAIVFAAGFMLGAIRTLWIVPRVGTRAAELAEAPIMLVVTIMAARWIVLRLAVPAIPSARLGIGPMLRLRGLSIKQYLAARDPVSGTVFCVMLGMLAMIPLFVTGR
jgi:hypothetical protein